MLRNDPIERIADVRDGFDRAAQRFERAVARQTPARGRDPSGKVTVAVAPNGALTDVVIDNRWFQALRPEDLGSAIMAAYQDAVVVSLNQWGTAVAEEADAPEPSTRPLPPTSESLYARLDDVVSAETLAHRSDASLQAMAELLRGVNRELDEITGRAVAAGSRTLVGGSRGARVTVTGTGAVVDVALDPDWASQTNAAGITQHVLTAHRDAARQASRGGIADVLADSKLGELQRLAADPRALAERLGLT